jgi:hypothetical protein
MIFMLFPHWLMSFRRAVARLFGVSAVTGLMGAKFHRAPQGMQFCRDWDGKLDFVEKWLPGPDSNQRPTG